MTIGVIKLDGAYGSGCWCHGAGSEEMVATDKRADARGRP